MARAPLFLFTLLAYALSLAAGSPAGPIAQEVVSPTVVERGLSNGERLTQGLPLAKPKRMYSTNARRGGGGSYPSNTPSSKISGSIEALDAATGAHIGWLTGGFVLLETHDPISFHFRYTKDVSGPTTLSYVSGGIDFTYFLNTAVGSTSSVISSNSGGALSTSFALGSPNPFRQANAWVITPGSLEVKASWSNPDGSRFTPDAYISTLGGLIFTGNAEKSSPFLGRAAKRLTLKFIPH